MKGYSPFTCKNEVELASSGNNKAPFLEMGAIPQEKEENLCGCKDGKCLKK